MDVAWIKMNCKRRGIKEEKHLKFSYVRSFVTHDDKSMFDFN